MGRDEVMVSGIEKFNGIDFAYWSMQIEDYLYGKKLQLPLLGKRPEKMDKAEWNLLDRQQKHKFDPNLLELEKAILASTTAVAALPAPSAPIHEAKPWQAFDDEPKPIPLPSNTLGLSLPTNGGFNQGNYVTAHFSSQVTSTDASPWVGSSQRFVGGLEEKLDPNKPSNWTGF